jgi:hypothetical protein
MVVSNMTRREIYSKPVFETNCKQGLPKVYPRFTQGLLQQCVREFLRNASREKLKKVLQKSAAHLPAHITTALSSIFDRFLKLFFHFSA